MGTWTIVIEGHGQNHNGEYGDADVLAKKFIEILRQYGHTEVEGAFVYGRKLVTGTGVVGARSVTELPCVKTEKL